jgi:hypothetical protein
MDEIANAVAILLDEIEEHHGEITDREIARRVAIVRVQLEELQLELDRMIKLQQSIILSGAPLHTGLFRGHDGPTRAGGPGLFFIKRMHNVVKQARAISDIDALSRCFEADPGAKLTFCTHRRTTTAGSHGEVRPCQR